MSATVAARTIVVQCLLLLGLTTLVLLAAAYAYDLVKQYDFLRTDCMIALIVTGIAATACLSGILHLLNRILDARPRPWYFRWLFFHLKQLLLVAQLLTTALALTAAGILLFNFKIP
jgi:hypothetical protein